MHAQVQRTGRTYRVNEAFREGGYIMELLKENIAKLFKVKTFVTLALTGVFCYLAAKGNVPDEFTAVYTMVVGFYFGTQAKKE